MSQYKSDAQLLQNQEVIYDSKFNRNMPEYVRESCKLFVYFLDQAFCHYDRYRLYAEGVVVTENNMREFYPQWDDLPPGYRKKIWRAEERRKKKADARFSELAKVFDMHLEVMKNWSEEQIEELEQLADAV